MNGEQLARLFVLGLFAFTLYLLYQVFKPFLPGIAWAIFLATAFYPVHTRLVRLLRGRETMAAILSTALVAALIVVPAVFMVLSLTQTVTGLVADMHLKGFTAGIEASEPGVLGDSTAASADPRSAQLQAPGAAAGESTPAHVPVPVPGAKRVPLVADLEAFLGRYVDVSKLNLEGTIIATLQQIGQTLARLAGSLVQNALWTLALFAIMIFTMVYMFREGPRLLITCKYFLPLSPEDREAVFRRLHEVTRAVFYGVFLTSVVQAALGAVGWAIVGLPSPLTFGTAMFFCSLLPVGGTFLVWGPGAVFLLLQGHPLKAIVLAVWGAAIVGLADNVLRPYFISGRTHMHSLLVFFGVLGGMAAFGIGGLFLGPLLITLFLFLLEVIWREMLHPNEGTSETTGTGG